MTSITTIPAWNGAGVLPPVRPGAAASSSDRSPYLIDLSSFIGHFATSSQRRKILDGLLRFRAALHQTGVIKGFQWLDGSFLEQIEVLENRAPRDLDVVNFVDLTQLDQPALFKQHERLFTNQQVRQDYALDVYFVEIGSVLDQAAVKSISYWHSMWSHRRDGQWKGFVQVDLNPEQDAAALAQFNLQGSI